MILKFSANTDDLYGEEGGRSFESLLSDSLHRAIVADAKTRLATDEFKKFSELVSTTIVADVKLRMQNFLSEEIVLTARYGEKQFVGSVEDLIKLRFDEVLLRPVDSEGKTLIGCTSANKTWIEWEIERQLGGTVKKVVTNATATITRHIDDTIKTQLVDLTNKTIQDKVIGSFKKIFDMAEKT